MPARAGVRAGLQPVAAVDNEAVKGLVADGVAVVSGASEAPRRDE